ncbi:MAG TPA: hypothetical protein VEW28_01925 [Candidatus Kapabacteria bacterium]|nr:hypothetical protein [Candidatus Kapabacteria bacterium]
MVVVYKTTVENKRDASNVVTALDRYLGAGNWSFDLDDRDKILRIEADDYRIPVVKNTVAALLTNNGFVCEELPV